MASSREYLDFVLEKLNALEGLTCRKMMGEYLLYYSGKLVGGIYDDRLLLKPTKSALRVMADSAGELKMETPYDGAKAMIAADIDDAELTVNVIKLIASEVK